MFVELKGLMHRPADVGSSVTADQLSANEEFYMESKDGLHWYSAKCLDTVVSNSINQATAEANYNFFRKATR